MRDHFFYPVTLVNQIVDPLYFYVSQYYHCIVKLLAEYKESYVNEIDSESTLHKLIYTFLFNK